MEKKISLFRIRTNDVEDFSEKICMIRKYENIERFQLCVRSSLLDEKFVRVMLDTGSIGEKYILRLEVDDEIPLSILENIRYLIRQIVIIAGNHNYIKKIEKDCRELKIDVRNFVQENNNLLSSTCRIRQIKNQYLTERKLIEALREYVWGGVKTEISDLEDLDDTREVILIPVESGLACQIFLYLFAVRVQQMTHRKVILDDSANYVRNAPAGRNKFIEELMWNYSLDKKQAEKCAEEAYRVISHFQFAGLELNDIFDLELSLLSNYFSADDWDLFIEKRCQQKFSLVPEILEREGYSINVIRDNVGAEFQNNLISMLCETSFKEIYCNHSKDYSVLKCFLNSEFHNIYLSVIGTSGDIGDSLFRKRSWVQSIMKFPIIDAQNREIYEEIGAAQSVIIHIRRGEKVYSDWELGLSYYKDSIRMVECINPDKMRYYLFSDSMEWCKENEVLLGLNEVKERLTFVEGNTGRNSYKDMQLMSNGTIMIPSPASNFGICALLFGKIEKCVDKRFFLEKHVIRIVDL